MTGLGKPFDDWLANVRKLTLSNDPNKNMVLFAAVEARHAHVRPVQLAAFLDQTYREYIRKACEGNSRGWFYAWFDEMSDTLRCGFHDAPSASGLPFRCKLEIVADPTKVAELILAVVGDGTIPWRDLRPSDSWEESERAPDFQLTVFARHI
jgi:hypothetical protein